MVSGMRKSGGKKPMTVLVVDDHPLFRDGLKLVLQQLADGTRVVTESDATRGLEAAQSIDDLDLVLLDLGMPGMDGFTAVERFAQVVPGVPVVIVSAHEEPAQVRRAIALGASGYIPKSTPAATLLDALRLVLGGGVYVPPLLVRAVRPQATGGAAGAAESASPEDLTQRQVDVLALLAQGKSNKAIARELDLSEKTVKAHVTAVFRALGVINRTQAALEARKRELIK